MKKSIIIGVWLVITLPLAIFFTNMQSPTTAKLSLQAVNGDSVDYAIARSSGSWYDIASIIVWLVIILIPIILLSWKKDHEKETEN